MREYIQSTFLKQSLFLFTLAPILLLLGMTNFPERTLLKETLSVLTILSFFQLIGQFYWARTNKLAREDLSMAKVIKYHKVVGYIFLSIIVFHPFYIVIPRFFEAGVSPLDAFTTMVTTFNSGIVVGLISWCSLVILGLTSYFRQKLPMSYTTWRVFHGLLSLFFIVTAAWHVIDLGRHSNLVMSSFIIVLSVLGSIILLRIYLVKK